MRNYLKIAYSVLMSAGLLLSCSTEGENELLLQTNVQDVHKAKYYEVDFGMLNESGVTGYASLVLSGDELTVTIEASGLEANQLHPQHIHGLFTDDDGEQINQNSKCPPPSADTNGDGLVDIPEGAPFYGGILVPLQPFPTADDQGNISFSATYTIDDSVTPLQNRTIVLHGLTVEDDDGDDTNNYWAGLPVACGQVTPMRRNNIRD